MKTKAIKWLSAQITDDTTVEQLNLIKFIKKCVNGFEVEGKVETKVDWMPYFEKLWKLYPRKIGKQNAIKQFEHKVRGLTEEECREKCVLIYKAECNYVKQIEDRETPMEYVKHFSTFLNSEVPNSKHYKGR